MPGLRVLLPVALLLLPLATPLLAPPAEAARVAPMAELPQPFLGASAVWTGEAVYIFGGREESNRYRSAILRYDPATGRTDKVGDLPASSVGPAARQSTAAIWTGTRAYVFGGAVIDPASQAPRSIPDIVVFDPAENTARNLHTGTVDMLPEPVFGTAAVWLDGRAYLFGGLKFVFAGPATEVEWQDRIMVFDPSAPVGARVTTLPARLPYKVQDAAAAVVDGKVYLMGGLAQTSAEEVSVVSSIVRFDPAFGTATRLDERLPRRLHFHGAGVLGGVVYVLGGRQVEVVNGREQATTSGAILEWRPGSAPREHPLTLPVPRYAASVATTPSGILALGGRDSGAYEHGMTSGYVFSSARGPPTAPTGARLEQEDRVVVHWRPPTYDGGAGIDGYRVERVDADGAIHTVGRVGAAERSLVDASAPGVGVVTYRILAYNGQGVGPAAVLRVELGPRPPDAPAEVNAWPGNAEVLLKWAPPTWSGGSTVSAYVVERSVDGVSSTFEVQGTEYVDTSVQNFVEYTYRVSARNDLGVGDATEPVAATPVPVPGTPSDFTLEDTTLEIRLTWSAVEGAGWYEVVRGRSPLRLEPLARVVGLEHVDSTVTQGGTYWYSVRAGSEHGMGIPTEPKRVQRLEFPSAPLNLTALAATEFVRLQWQTPSSLGGDEPTATTYVLERGRGNEPFTIIANDLRASAFMDRTVEPGVGYSYRVAAVNSLGKGAYSDILDVDVRSDRNEPPRAALRATPAGTTVGVNVTFDASFATDADGEVVEYLFEFGDGTETGWILTPTVTHAYRRNGVYTASVLVRDDLRAESRPALAQVVIGPDPNVEDVDTGEDDLDGEEPDADVPGSSTPRLPGPGLLAAVAAVALAVLLSRRRS